MALWRVIDFCTPFLFEEEKAYCFGTCRFTHSLYSDYLLEVRADYRLMRWWKHQLHMDELEERSSVLHREIEVRTQHLEIASLRVSDLQRVLSQHVQFPGHAEVAQRP